MGVTKILIANRGEIAVRVIGTARKMGYPTVSVYSTADAQAPHVRLADQAVCLGPPSAAESYLAVDRVLAAARQVGADAIHPGYGFLSENAGFARACDKAGITFIGPPASAIDLMGNKRAAKRRMQQAGVPCVPGYSGEDQSDATLADEARRIGFPVMVKAAAGGGGRGMRLVAGDAELVDALRGARAEAQSAFGSGELILEKAVVEPRHVEIQVFGDRQGNVIHLGERDCSVQRRHQKVIEESPSPAVDPSLREAMGAAAVEAAKACGYVGAGTVEFLLDGDQSFYFLEMNTRLQVEHPVTELVTGLDLVEWQIRVARGEPLPLSQGEVVLRGHAVEARLYAEDPARGFMPQTGRVVRWRPAPGAVRVDAGIVEGGSVSPHYDPMIAKLIAYGNNREDACRALSRALRDTTLFGVITNKTFLANICDHEVFADGGATTAFLADHFAGDPSCAASPPGDDVLALAALVVVLEGTRGLVEDDSFIAWRSGGPVGTAVCFAGGDANLDLSVEALGPGKVGPRFGVSRESDGEATPVVLEVVVRAEEAIDVLVDEVPRRVRYVVSGDAVWIDDGVSVTVLENKTHTPATAASAAGSGMLTAPLDGKVMEVFVREGAAVERGARVVVVEAMKMEHQIKADVDGIVSRVHVRAGDQVKTRQLLAEITPREGA